MRALGVLVASQLGKVGQGAEDRVEAEEVYTTHAEDGCQLDRAEGSGATPRLGGAATWERGVPWVTLDGCMLGYRDQEPGRPYKNPLRFLTYSEVIVGFLEPAGRCDGSRDHQHLDGTSKYGSRTKQAVEWPNALNVIVKDAILQQSDVDGHHGLDGYAAQADDNLDDAHGAGAPDDDDDAQNEG